MGKVAHTVCDVVCDDGEAPWQRNINRYYEYDQINTSHGDIGKTDYFKSRIFEKKYVRESILLNEGLK